VDHDIKGSLRGLLERGVQVARDAEETADDYVMLSVGYAGAVGTSLWAEIKEDRAKVVWLSSSIMTILIPDSRLIKLVKDHEKTRVRPLTLSLSVWRM
jgi:hypothetical protein